jgi:hypothetical protein
VGRVTQTMTDSSRPPITVQRPGRLAANCRL